LYHHGCCEFGVRTALPSFSVVPEILCDSMASDIHSFQLSFIVWKCQ